MSKSAGKKPKEKSDKTKADNFVWTTAACRSYK